MTKVVVLDAGPLGLATNPRRSKENIACAHWLQALVASGTRVILPEIADYEVRRELLRANKRQGLNRLDGLAELIDYLAITTTAMRRAASLWSQARKQGHPTADDKSLDCDVILAAQAIDLGVPELVVATTNVDHLSRFVTAALWRDVKA